MVTCSCTVAYVFYVFLFFDLPCPEYLQEVASSTYPSVNVRSKSMSANNQVTSNFEKRHHIACLSIPMIKRIPLRQHRQVLLKEERGNNKLNRLGNFFPVRSVEKER